MPTIISPQNNIIIQLEKKYDEEFVFESGLKLYKDINFHPEESVMLIGTVVSIPRSIIKRVDYEGYNDLPEVGDKVLIRYDVVFAYTNQPDRDTPIYKNLFVYEGVEYWMVDIMQVFAVQQGEDYKMLNGYIMCNPVSEERSLGKLLITPDYMREEIRRDRYRVKYSPLGAVQAGELIYCTPNVAQQYRIGSDEFYIIKESHLQAVAL